MGDFNGKLFPKYYKYLVLFSSEAPSFNAAIKASNYVAMREENKGSMLQLDKDIIEILPIFEYCLHLPRSEFDVCDIDTVVIDKAYDVPQDIVFCPESAFEELIGIIDFDIIFCSDSCFSNIKSKVNEKGLNVECVQRKDLSNELLKKHWNLMYERRHIKRLSPVKDIEIQYLLKEEQLLFLPMLFVERQYGRADSVYQTAFNTLNVFEDAAKMLFKQNCHHQALMGCLGLTNTDEFTKKFDEGFEFAKNKGASINLVITYPGVAEQQIKYGGLSRDLPIDERNALRIIGIHRAIAKRALLMELPLTSPELFKKLNELEINVSGVSKANNSYVHKAIKDISGLLQTVFTYPQLWSINRSKQISVLSNFPLSLYVPDKTDVTLQCQKEVSFRPLSPLTRCMQIEMSKHLQIYLGYRCRVLFVECVPDTDANKAIRMCSSLILNSLEESSKNSSKFEYQYEEAYSVKELVDLLNRSHDKYEMLILSAHGFNDRNSNIAGLCIGEEKWMAEDNSFFVPPIVLLSACHVSPRGNGSISAADLFMRAKAEAVLSSFITIDAHRNAILITRLLSYIVAAQNGNKQYKTILEAWGGIVASNAVLEIVKQSKKFEDWLFGNNSDGISRFIDFTTKRSVNRLRVSHIYEDTITIIKEMLHEEGLDDKFSNVLNHADYFPESFFYQWIGFPENVFIFNEEFEKVVQEISGD